MAAMLDVLVVVVFGHTRRRYMPLAIMIIKKMHGFGFLCIHAILLL